MCASSGSDGSYKPTQKKRSECRQASPKSGIGTTATRTPSQYAAELMTLLFGNADPLSDLSGVTTIAPRTIEN
jgi:hypothetical protein